MSTLAPLLWASAWLALPVAAGFAAFFYGYHRRARPDPERRIPVVGYIVALMASALVGFAVGVAWGISWGCALPYQGNLCGLWGFLFGGPVVSAIAIFLVGWLITLVPADVDPPPRIKTWTLASVSRTLWRGQYSVGTALWGFFVLGHFVAVALGGVSAAACLFIVPGLSSLVFRLVPVAYALIAGVGVWRSADATAGATTRLAARALVVAAVIWLARPLLLLALSPARI